MPSDDRRSKDESRAAGLNPEEERRREHRRRPDASDRRETNSHLDSVVVPLAEERVVIDRRQIETGRVRVSTEVGVRQQAVEVELLEEEVEVRRVPVGREVEGPVEIRQEGDVTIIPVLEEVVVVHKQLILREEVHLRRHSRSRNETRTVDLRYEEPLIERLPADEDGSE